jgi:MOSC domain-containing protein YiiM
MSHLTYSELSARLRALPPPPRDEGEVVLVVARPDTELRETPDRVRLTPEGGVDGDRWGARPRPNPETQITVMRADVAEVIAAGQPLTLFGDNLLVYLDLSSAHLPPGTRVWVGSALCEVTPMPHTGCGKFARRFGQDARDITGAPEFQDQHLRGIHFRVLEPGEVGPGDPIRVIRP